MNKLTEQTKKDIFAKLNSYRIPLNFGVTISYECNELSNFIEKEKLLECNTAEEINNFINRAISYCAKSFGFTDCCRAIDYLKHNDPTFKRAFRLLIDIDILDNVDSIFFANLVCQEDIKKQLNDYKDEVFMELNVNF